MNWKNAIAATLATLIGTVTPAFAWNGVWAVGSFLAGIGLPQILIWALTFAISFAVVSKVLSRAPATIISIVVGFLALMAAPAALLTVLGTMSTGLLVVGIGIIVLVALLSVAGTKHFDTDPKTGMPDLKTAKPWLMGHGTAVAAVLVALAAIIFVAAGGLPLIGIPSIPVIGWGTWLLIIVGVGVLWMLSEAQQ